MLPVSKRKPELSLGSLVNSAGATGVKLVDDGRNRQVSLSAGAFLSAAATCVLLQGVLYGDEVLQRLGHLASGDGQVSRVQEVAHPVVVLKESLDARERERESGQT